MNAAALAVAPAVQALPSSPAQLPSLRELFGDLSCRWDIPNDVYHADRSCVSVSGLKQILRSPAHFQAYLSGEQNKQTPAMYMGTAVHARVLEPAVFQAEYVVAPVGDKRSKQYKEFEIANADKKILTPEQMVTLEGIAQSVSRHANAATLIQAGLIEHSFVWQDELTGIWLKIRPDCLCTDFETGICLDLKKTLDAGNQPFARSAVNYGYDLQAAVYLEGLRKIWRRDFDFAFLAVEEDSPHACALYGAPAEMLERGHRMFRKALNRLAICRETDEWPAYQPNGDFEILDWPHWAK